MTFGALVTIMIGKEKLSEVLIIVTRQWQVDFIVNFYIDNI